MRPSGARPLAHLHSTETGCDCCPQATRRSSAGQTRRRGLFGLPLGLGALLALGAGSARAAPAADNPKSPAEALAALMAGNQRYVAARRTACGMDLPRVLQQTEGRQAPFAAVLACADSRVPVELVFDQGIGDVFVTRVAGNVATPEIIASLEYGVAVLGTRAIVVLGHRNCGAVAATLARKAAPGQISGLYAFIRPAADRGAGDLDKAIRINAALQAGLLAQSSPVLAEAIAGKRLAVTPAYYDLGTGKVTLLAS